MNIDIKQEVTELKEELIAVRRDFHMHPELAFEEHRTAKIVAEKLVEFGLEVETGIAGTGVVGRLTKGRGNVAVGLREDLDELLAETFNLWLGKFEVRECGNSFNIVFGQRRGHGGIVTWCSAAHRRRPAT